MKRDSTKPRKPSLASKPARARPDTINTKAPKIDIRSVAAHARVSIATVSRTVNHVATVDPSLAARVWKAVSELNYRPNTQARALVSGRSRMLGLVVSEITNPFFPELIREFEEVAVAQGYELLIGSTDYNPRKMEDCARRMLERKVDGVAIMTFGFEDALVERFADEGIPVALIDVAPSSTRVNRLSVDYGAGIHEGIQHLAVLGHRKIGFISGPLHLHSAAARLSVFHNCLRTTGIVPQKLWMVEGDHTLDGGRDAMNKILALTDWPTAIMCSNDMTAIGVQHALFEANLKVPADFSLIGFDDIHLAEYTIPPLTTVRMSCRDLAKAAIKCLLARVQPGNSTLPTVAQVTTKLIVRQTTGLPRNTMQDLQPLS
ncbi:LacI family DNA-binding transcriptional regulator [Granulicella paludicola]|uniref:LacI family DNA-binding transcriptional regulator n=1 Tax=Granulicella paludicola TaxID=474951 RepID=UPI00295B8041|nr:LacI family DNA-binding transcriptional regulator [Granulicella paludicola]